MSLVVFLHPIGLDRHTWQFLRGLTDYAPERSPANGAFEAVRLDLPGHGDAPPLAGLTLEAVADQVAEHIGDLGGPAHVVGLSMGAMVAQHLALRHPKRVESLVIAGAGATAAAPVLRERADTVERAGMAGVLDDYLSRWFTPAALAGGDHPGVAYARDRLLADDPATVAAYWRAMAEHDVLAHLSGITVPTTVVAGSVDRSAPVDRLRDIHERIPGSRLVVIDGPHMLQLERPKTLQELLTEHLYRQRRAA